MKKCLMILALVFVGCDKSSDDKTPAVTVEGVDYSGTWVLANVQCYNSALTVQTNTATVTNGYTETVVITGNSYAVTISAPGCSVSGSGRLVANASTVTLSSRVISSASGGSCSAALAISGTAITPNPSSSTFSNGQTLSTVTNLPYVYNSTSRLIGLPSVLSDGGGGYCFLAYQKQ